MSHAAGYRVNDRRAFARYVVSQARLLADVQGYSCKAEVLDLSRGGIRFRSSVPSRSGQLLSLDLIGPRDERSEPLLVQVLNSRPGGPKSFITGCCFLAPLSVDDLQVVLSWIDVTEAWCEASSGFYRADYEFLPGANLPSYQV